MKKLILTYIGRDNWSRPVYKSGDDLFVDVNPRKNSKPEICTKHDNQFYGELDTPIEVVKKYKDFELEFVPERDTREF